MAANRGQGAGGGGQRHALIGLRVLALLLGVFFVFQAMDKLSWLTDSSILAARFERYRSDALPITRWYLETIAMPGVPAFARIVFCGELATGLALLSGFWTRLAAGLAFFMVLNFHVASGSLFEFSFLTDGYGLPVLSGLLGLAIGGKNLPFSVSKT